MISRHETLSDVDDSSVVAALRLGDEAAFVWLVGTYHASFVRVARSHVSSDAIAEEVAQEAWLGVLRGIDGFEGRARLKTWMFRILLNIARSRGVREKRCVPISALAHREAHITEEAQLREQASPVSVGWLDRRSSLWDGLPEERAEAHEIRELIVAAIESLPPAQREVITLRDIELLTSAEACSLLDITPGNQRILLHRARAKIRAALACYLEPRVATVALAG